MSERELQQENERLRRDLETANKSRDRLREIICAILPVDRTEMTQEELDDLLKNAKPVDELLREILPPELHATIQEE